MNPHTKPMACVALLLGVLLRAPAQTTMGGFSESREIRYPRSFDVQAPSQVRTTGTQTGGPAISQFPVVVPTDFATRRLGAHVETRQINVSGRVLVRSSHDGSEIVSLRGNNGMEIRVATGTFFQLGEIPFRAEGFSGDKYLVRNMRDQQVYFFVWNQ